MPKVQPMCNILLPNSPKYDQCAYSDSKTAHSMPTIQYSAQDAQHNQMISLPKIQLSKTSNQILVNNVQYSVAPKPAQNMPDVQQISVSQTAQNMPNLNSVS